MPPWEYLLKKILWNQLGEIKGKRILDFGSGTGITADHYAKGNEVIAVEPSAEAIAQRSVENVYQQLLGSIEILRSFPKGSFDIIFCHNVLEYAEDREQILREFHRLLKPDGFVSVVKHNPAGRVMQMVVLLNAFDRAQSILDGENDTAVKYGAIRYFDDFDLVKWCDGFSLDQVYGIRTFWDLQQNQDCHKDPAWQEKMINMELRVAQIEEFRNIAFFHHIILNKGGADCHTSL